MASTGINQRATTEAKLFEKCTTSGVQCIGGVCTEVAPSAEGGS